MVNMTVNIEQTELIVTLVQQKKKDIKRIKIAKQQNTAATKTYNEDILY